MSNILLVLGIHIIKKTELIEKVQRRFTKIMTKWLITWKEERTMKDYII